MSNAESLNNDLQAIGGLIAKAHDLVQAGETIDLAPLEPQVLDICSQIEGLPATEGQAVKPRLIALIDNFNRLSQAIEDKLGEVKDSLGQTAGRRQAISAYGQHESGKK